MEKEKLLKDTQVSEMIGLAAQTLRNDRHAGRGLPYFKIGSSVRYRWSDVVEYLERRRVVPKDSRR